MDAPLPPWAHLPSRQPRVAYRERLVRELAAAVVPSLTVDTEDRGRVIEFAYRALFEYQSSAAYSQRDAVSAELSGLQTKLRVHGQGGAAAALQRTWARLLNDADDVEHASSYAYVLLQLSGRILEDDAFAVVPLHLAPEVTVSNPVVHPLDGYDYDADDAAVEMLREWRAERIDLDEAPSDEEPLPARTARTPPLQAQPIAQEDSMPSPVLRMEVVSPPAPLERAFGVLLEPATAATHGIPLHLASESSVVHATEHAYARAAYEAAVLALCDAPGDFASYTHAFLRTQVHACAAPTWMHALALAERDAGVSEPPQASLAMDAAVLAARTRQQCPRVISHMRSLLLAHVQAHSVACPVARFVTRALLASDSIELAHASMHDCFAAPELHDAHASPAHASCVMATCASVDPVHTHAIALASSIVQSRMQCHVTTTVVKHDFETGRDVMYACDELPHTALELMLAAIAKHVHALGELTRYIAVIKRIPAVSNVLDASVAALDAAMAGREYDDNARNEAPTCPAATAAILRTYDAAIQSMKRCLMRVMQASNDALTLTAACSTLRGIAQTSTAMLHMLQQVHETTFTGAFRDATTADGRKPFLEHLSVPLMERVCGTDSHVRAHIADAYSTSYVRIGHAVQAHAGLDAPSVLAFPILFTRVTGDLSMCAYSSAVIACVWMSTLSNAVTLHSHLCVGAEDAAVTGDDALPTVAGVIQTSLHACVAAWAAALDAHTLLDPHTHIHARDVDAGDGDVLDAVQVDLTHVCASGRVLCTCDGLDAAHARVHARTHALSPLLPLYSNAHMQAIIHSMGDWFTASSCRFVSSAHALRQRLLLREENVEEHQRVVAMPMEMHSAASVSRIHAPAHLLAISHPPPRVRGHVAPAAREPVLLTAPVYEVDANAHAEPCHALVHAFPWVTALMQHAQALRRYTNMAMRMRASIRVWPFTLLQVLQGATGAAGIIQLVEPGPAMLLQDVAVSALQAVHAGVTAAHDAGDAAGETLLPATTPVKGTATRVIDDSTPDRPERALPSAAPPSAMHSSAAHAVTTVADAASTATRSSRSASIASGFTTPAAPAAPVLGRGLMPSGAFVSAWWSITAQVDTKKQKEAEQAAAAAAVQRGIHAIREEGEESSDDDDEEAANDRESDDGGAGAAADAVLPFESDNKDAARLESEGAAAADDSAGDGIDVEVHARAVDEPTVAAVEPVDDLVVRGGVTETAVVPTAAHDETSGTTLVAPVAAAQRGRMSARALAIAHGRARNRLRIPMPASTRDAALPSLGRAVTHVETGFAMLDRLHNALRAALDASRAHVVRALKQALLTSLVHIRNVHMHAQSHVCDRIITQLEARVAPSAHELTRSLRDALTPQPIATRDCFTVTVALDTGAVVVRMRVMPREVAENVFPPHAQAVYEHVFTHILSIKRLLGSMHAQARAHARMHAVVRARTARMLAPTHGQPLTPAQVSAHGTISRACAWMHTCACDAHALRVCVHALLQHTLHGLLTTPWATLLVALRAPACNSIDAVLAAHEQYVNSIMRRCFMAPEQEAAAHAIAALLGMISKFNDAAHAFMTAVDEAMLTCVTLFDDAVRAHVLLRGFNDTRADDDASSLALTARDTVQADNDARSVASTRSLASVRSRLGVRTRVVRRARPTLAMCEVSTCASLEDACATLRRLQGASHASASAVMRNVATLVRSLHTSARSHSNAAAAAYAEDIARALDYNAFFERTASAGRPVAAATARSPHALTGTHA